MPWANHFQNYEAHLITPGKLNAAGISWFGSPFFLDGFNDRITWSASWNFPNIADIYEEQLNPHNPFQYLYDNSWRNIAVEHETFKFKAGTGMDSITLPCYYTHHGPVVEMDLDGRRAFSARLPNFDGVNYSTGMYRLMKARCLDEFKAVLSDHLIPCWNFLYTDRNTVYWVDNAAIAERTGGYDWRKPVPGWTKRTEWGPYLPLERLPQLLNPTSGFVQNCNNPPWLSTTDSHLDPMQPAPYFQMEVPHAYKQKELLNARGERLLKLLTETKNFTLEDVKGLAFDTYVVPADVIVPLLIKAWSSRGSLHDDPQVAHAIDVLTSWNRSSSQHSIGQTYMYFWGRAYQDLFSGQKFSRFLGYARYKISFDSEEQEMALRALKEAIRQIAMHFGRTDVPWGEVNVARRGRIFPMDGTGLFDVLHPDQGTQQANGQVYDQDGWGHILIVVESEPKEAWSLLPYGESEDRTSPHYADMAKLHSERKLKRFWFTLEEIQDHTQCTWGERKRITRLTERFRRGS